MNFIIYIGIKYLVECCLVNNNGWLWPTLFYCITCAVKVLRFTEFSTEGNLKNFIFQRNRNLWIPLYLWYYSLFCTFDARFGWKVKVGSTRQLCSAQMGFFWDCWSPKVVIGRRKLLITLQRMMFLQ